MKRVCILILALVFSGCATVQNAREAKLMPAAVAKSILEKYAGKAWVENPTGAATSGYCTHEQQSLPFYEINKANVPIFAKNTFIVWNTKKWCLIMHVIGPVRDTPLSEDELNDIVDALVSLGAKLSEAKRE